MEFENLIQGLNHLKISFEDYMRLRMLRDKIYSRNKNNQDKYEAMLMEMATRAKNRIEFKSEFKYIRLCKGISLEEMAQAFNITVENLRQIEDNKSDLKSYNLIYGLVRLEIDFADYIRFKHYYDCISKLNMSEEDKRYDILSEAMDTFCIVYPKSNKTR